MQAGHFNILLTVNKHLTFRIPDWQHGILKHLRWAVLSSLMTDLPCENANILLKVSLQLCKACGLRLGSHGKKKNTNKSSFSSPSRYLWCQSHPRLPSHRVRLARHPRKPRRPLKVSLGVKGGSVFHLNEKSVTIMELPRRI